MSAAAKRNWPDELKGMGDRVKLVRKGRKMTKRALAAHVGCDPSTITRLESGERLVELPTLIVLARVLGVSPGWILTGEGALPELTPAAPSDRDGRRRRP